MVLLAHEGEQLAYMFVLLLQISFMPGSGATYEGEGTVSCSNFSVLLTPPYYAKKIFLLCCFFIIGFLQ